MATRIILASGSAIRARILADAGVDFDIVKPDVDEDEIKASEGPEANLEALAMLLAEAKALAVDATDDALVIGADQILEFENRGYDKPRSLDEARDRLLLLAGKTHSLINASCVAMGGRIVYRNLDRPRLTMRAASAHEIDRYIDLAGPVILTSVGAYQVERLGVRLFDAIDGDATAVLGLSLLPLLRFLRHAGALTF